MTMPHLMNCPHMSDGWCLDCVNKQWEEMQALRKDAAPSIQPTAVPVYLVATGLVYKRFETYTRHETRPSLCDAETLYTTPQASPPVQPADK